MTNETQPVKRRGACWWATIILASVIGMCQIVAGLSCLAYVVGRAVSTSPAPAPAPSSSAPVSSSSKITFSNVIWRAHRSITTVEGEATNHDSRTHSFALTVSFYNSSGRLLGVAYGSLFDLGPGQTKTWSASADTDLTVATRYRVDVAVMMD